MEFVIVRFPRVRQVMMDGAPQGDTNRRLRVQAGTHSFDLDVPPDYNPSSQTITVIGTSPQTPMDVVFTETAAPAGMPKAAKKKAAKKAARKKTVKRKSANRKATQRKTVRRKTASRGKSTR